MAQQENPNPNPGTLAEVVRSTQLVWRLLNDPRVPFLPKLIIPAIVIYIVSPIDLIPDVIPVFGQMDDIAVAFFGIRFFIAMCPPDVVLEHRRAIAGEPASHGGEYVDATFRVVDRDGK